MAMQRAPAQVRRIVGVGQILDEPECSFQRA